MYVLYKTNKSKEKYVPVDLDWRPIDVDGWRPRINVQHSLVVLWRTVEVILRNGAVSNKGQITPKNEVTSALRRY